MLLSFFLDCLRFFITFDANLSPEGSPVKIKIFFIIPTFSALSGEDIYEGKEADRIIKSGLVQETINEEDHKHLVIEYDNDFFWCTVEKNGNKSCVLY